MREIFDFNRFFIKNKKILTIETHNKIVMRLLGFIRKAIKEKIAKIIAVLVVIALIITCVQVLTTTTSAERISFSAPNLGADENLTTISGKLTEHESNNTIKERAETELSRIDWSINKTEKKRIDYNTQHEVFQKPPWNKVFSDIENASNNGDISYSLGIEYYVFTYYQDYEKITTGKLFAETNSTLLNTALNIALEKWYPIDVDYGDSDINVAVTLQGEVKNIVPNINLPMRQATLKAQLAGGLKIEISKTNPDLDSPLSVYFVKPMSYEGKTYVWVGGFNFSYLPQSFSFIANSENINLELSGTVVEVLPPKIDWGVEAVDVKPPYNVNWSLAQDIDHFFLCVGYETGTDVKKRYQLEADFSPGIRNGNLRYEETPNIQRLIWHGAENTTVSCKYREEDLCTEIKIDKLPNNIELVIENRTSYSNMTYSASSNISNFSYRCYDFAQRQITCINLEDLPKNINLTGTFKIPPKEEPTPEPSGSIIGNIMNTVAARIASALRRVAKTFRSIPETITSPNNMFHIISSDGCIKTIEFGVLYGNVQDDCIYAEYPEIDKNFIAFSNSSVFVKISDIIEFNLSSGEILDLYLHTAYRDSLYILSTNGSNETLINISELPEEISVHGRNKNFTFSSTSAVDIEFLCCGENYMRAAIKGISDFNLTTENNITRINFTKNISLELEFAEKNAELYHMMDTTGNYIFANLSEFKVISARLSNISSLTAGKKVGISSQTAPLKLLFIRNSTIGKIILKNMPKEFEFLSPEPLISLPQIENISLFKGAEVLSLFGAVGEQITKTLSEVNKNFALYEELEIAYEASENFTVIANVTSGNDFVANWTNGITIKNRNGNTDARVYLELPQKANLHFEYKEKFTLSARFEHYYPTYDWLVVKAYLENQNITVYLSNLTYLEEGNAYLEIKPNLASGIVSGAANFSLSSCLGSVFAVVERNNLSAKLFISAIPESVNASFNIGTGISLAYKASRIIDLLCINITKKEKGEHSCSITIRSMPREFSFTATSKQTFEPDELSVAQIVPEIQLSSSDIYDFYFFLDGRAIGRKGVYEIYAEKAKSLSIKEQNGGIVITASTSINKVFVSLRNYRFTTEYKINELSVLISNLVRLYLKIHFLFGKIPVFEISSTGMLQINISHEFSLLSGMKKKDAMLANISPLTLNTQKNSMSVKDSNTHYVIPALMMSLW